jgi:hypothetical protein
VARLKVEDGGNEAPYVVAEFGTVVNQREDASVMVGIAVDIAE